MTETYVSIDIETDGPCPGLNSMLSLGAVAIDEYGNELATWTNNFYPLDGAVQNTETMKWWDTQPEAWKIVTQNRFFPEKIIEFADWLEVLPNKPIAVAWPASFDFSFVNYYLWKFANKNPLGFACLDIRSLAVGMTKSKGYYKLKEKELRKLVPNVDKTGLKEHVALDDAIEQGRLFIGLLKILKQS